MTDKQTNRYIVSVPISATYYETVYATSEKEAIENLNGFSGLCYHCSNELEVNVDFDTDEAEVYLDEVNVTDPEAEEEYDDE